MSEDDEPDAAAAALQAEKDKRGGVKRSQNGMKACNWWVGDADQGHYCGKAAGYSADKTTGLFRCIGHGGNAQKIMAGTQNSGRSGCSALHLPRPQGCPPCRDNSGHYATSKYKGFEWTGRCCNQTCADAIAKALYQHEHEGVPYPEGFRPPPPTSAPSAAATTQ